MRYRIRLHGRWEIPLVPPTGDGKYQPFPPLVLEPGEYDAALSENPYPFGAVGQPYLLLSKDGQRGGYSVHFWRLWQHDALDDRRVEVITIDD